jgi:hypothetical protein
MTKMEDQTQTLAESEIPEGIAEVFRALNLATEAERARYRVMAQASPYVAVAFPVSGSSQPLRPVAR